MALETVDKHFADARRRRSGARYSLIDQIDWDIGLAEKKGKVIECGLYDLNRQPGPVADAYRQLLTEYGQITIVPHGEVFEMSNEPARLKVEV